MQSPGKNKLKCGQFHLIRCRSSPLPPWYNSPPLPLLVPCIYICRHPMALYFYPPSFIIWLAGLAISTLWRRPRRPSSSPTPPSWLLDITHNPAVTTATDTTVTTIHWQHNYLYTTKSTVRIVVGALVDGYMYVWRCSVQRM